MIRKYWEKVCWEQIVLVHFHCELLYRRSLHSSVVCKYFSVWSCRMCSWCFLDCSNDSPCFHIQNVYQFFLLLCPVRVQRCTCINPYNLGLYMQREFDLQWVKDTVNLDWFRHLIRLQLWRVLCWLNLRFCVVPIYNALSSGVLFLLVVRRWNPKYGSCF